MSAQDQIQLTGLDGQQAIVFEALKLGVGVFQPLGDELAIAWSDGQPLTNKDVVFKWFARGRVWESPEAAHAAALAAARDQSFLR